MLTHTAEPLAGVPGAVPTYGCLEFVFRVGRSPAAEHAERVVSRIEQWLEWTPVERLCAAGIDPLCTEP